jgi:hypothetical protein
MMRSLTIVVLAVALAGLTPVSRALAQNAVSEYLSDGWDIKAVSQISGEGYTQIIMQKGVRGVVCSIYYSAVDRAWTGKGCDPLP